MGSAHAASPVCQSQSVTAREDTAGLSITLKASDSDGDLNTVSYLVFSPAHGTVSPSRGSAQITYKPNANWTGTDSFTWTVQDNAGKFCASGKVTVTVTAVNDAPVANPVSGSGVEDQQTPITVTLNGKDIDTVATALSYKLCPYSPCKLPSSSITVPDAGGTATVSGSTVRYTPTANDNGPVTFYYKVFDGQLYSTTSGKVTLSVASVNDVPVASPAQALTGEEQQVQITLTATDADADTLSCVMTAPANGTIDPPTASDCKTTFAPAPGFFGTTSFTYAVTDGKGGTSDAQTVTVRVLKDGTYLGAWPSAGSGLIESFATVAGGSPRIVHTFVDTTQSFYAWRDSFMDHVHGKGAVNLLTLEAKDPATGKEVGTAEINAGLLDEKFLEIATLLKSWQHGAEVWVRILHEGNGFWYAWGIGNENHENTDESYKQAFQRVANIFKSEAGAANVKIVYAVNNTNERKSPQNVTHMGGYPGDAYVDYVALDGYNWAYQPDDAGNVTPEWKSFREVFDDAYAEVSAVTSKPMLIAEFACAEDDTFDGSRKAAWIADAFAQLKAGAYPNVVGTVWFDENKEREWSLTGPASSDAIQSAYRNRYQ